MKVQIKRLHNDAILPNYAHPGDVGMDLYSLEDCTLLPGKVHIFKMGFALEFPVGYAGIVKDKSSMGAKGITTVGGVYDAGYRGEYNVGLLNNTNTPFDIAKGQKIAQLILFPVAIATLEEVDELSDTSRGTGAFGSTGKF